MDRAASMPLEAYSRVAIGSPSARKAKATGTMATAELRSPCEMSSRTAPGSLSWAAREIRGSTARP